MRLAALIFLSFLFLCQSVFFEQASAIEQPAKVKIGKFGDLQKRVEASDTTVDFAELRLAYVKTGSYKPYRDDLDKIRKEMLESFVSQNYNGTIELAKKILKKEYINIEAHMYCEMAYDSLGDSANGAFHRWVTDGLIGSVLYYGDGKSEETAYTVVLISEEYALLNTLGYQVTSQALSTGKDGSFFDVFEVIEAKSGSSLTIYFDITMPFSRLKNSFH